MAQDDWVKTTDLKNSDLKMFMDQAPQDKILKAKRMNTHLKVLCDLDVEEFMLES